MAAKPHVEALAKELAGKITVVSVNVDEVPSDVLTIPTFTFYRDGKELVGVPGWRGRPALRKLMEEQIALGEKPARKTKVKP
jgi:thioredoxin-like negative regulator of GroEL